MANDSIRIQGQPPGYKADPDKTILINHPVIGLVKSNIDATHSGKIQVYIAEYSGPDTNKGWFSVNYMSPWFGIAGTQDQSTSEWGKFVGNSVSYGMWATAPDVGSTVICIFINGRPDQGYYIGSPPTPGLHHMVPAIGSASGFVPNSAEATTYADATVLPVSEVNIANKAIENSTSIYTEPKPVHSYQAAILSKQGLIRDTVRGVISSSSQRETPSRVFGISTPGQTIYTGGYTNSTIAKAAETADQSKLQVAARTGGHSIVLDDGTVDGKDQLMRFRTSAGHMIMMSDSGQSIFVIHSNGQSWVELGKEGTVDIWSSNSFNVRTLGDINLHADRDVNIHAGRNLNMFGTNIKAQTDANMSILTGGNFTTQHGGKYSMKAGGTMSLQSIGTASFMSLAGQNYINGLKVNLNSGVGPQPDNVQEIVTTQHQDTIYSQKVGWMYPSPYPLVSIASRVTTHQPYSGANKGVDVQINSQVAPETGTTTNSTLMAINSSAPPVPNVPTTSAAIATVNGATPIVSQDSTILSRSVVSGLISQQSAAVTGLSDNEAASRGTISGTVTGISLRQAESGGAIKANSAEFARSLLEKGLTFTEAGKVLMSGAPGIPTPQSLVNNVQQQVTTLSQSIQTETTTLVNNGLQSLLTGNSSQSAGIINAASNLGASTVTNAVNNVQASLSSNFQNVSTQISQLGTQLSGFTQSITNGQFVANIQDKLVGGIGDFSTNFVGVGVSKILGGFGGRIKGVGEILAGLQQSAQQNFLAAQAAFKPLKAGQPNYSDNNQQQSTSDYVALVDAVSSKQDTISELEKDLVDLKRAARRNPSIENENKIIELETLLGRNKQQLAQLNSQISSINVSAVASDIAGATNLPTTNITNIVANGSNAADIVKNLVDPNSLAGNLLGKVPAPVSRVLSKFIGGGGVKQAVLAEGTARSTTIAENAKTAQLFDDPIIPPLEFGTPSKSINPNDYLREQNVILNKLKDLRARQQILESQLEKNYIQMGSNTSGQEFRNMSEIQSQLADIENQIKIAEAEYYQLIT